MDFFFGFCMYNNNYPFSKQTNCNPSLFTVILTVILESKNWSGEHFFRLSKIKAMANQIILPLGFVPCISHNLIRSLLTSIVVSANECRRAATAYSLGMIVVLTDSTPSWDSGSISTPL